MNESNSKEQNRQECWLFNFSLESEDGEKLSREYPEQLIDVIIDWAEKNKCQVGGGYRAPDYNGGDSLYPVNLDQ